VALSLVQAVTLKVRKVKRSLLLL
ncbi:cysteine synthase A, partial [Vibrio parahaemolyticus V-223/04]